MWIIGNKCANSPSLQAPEEVSSADIFLVGEPSAPWKSSLTRHQSLSKDKTKESSNRSLFGMMSVHLMECRGAEKLMWYLEDSPAKTFPAQEKAQESTENGRGFGVKCTELSVKYDPDTHSWKTVQCLLSEDLPESSVTLPKSGMMRRGQLLELTMLERPTSGNEFGYSRKIPNGVDFFHTPNYTGLDGGSNSRKALRNRMIAQREKFLTPMASDARRSQMKLESLRKRYEKHPQGNLAKQVAMFPTPRTKGMCGGTGSFEQMKKLQEQGMITDEERRKMTAGNGGALNPDWVEWLMAFPIGWTDLKPLETPKFRSWQRLLSESLKKF